MIEPPVCEAVPAWAAVAGADAALVEDVALVVAAVSVVAVVVLAAEGAKLSGRSETTLQVISRK